MFRKKLAAAAALTLALTLAGCGGPSTSDVQSAVQSSMRKQVQQLNGMLTSMGGAAVAKKAGLGDAENVTVTDVDILDSQKQKNGVYIVKATMTITAGQQQESDSMRLILKETDDGWTVVDMGKL